MNYLRLWKQVENYLILNDSIKLIEKLKQNNGISFARAKIKSWDELCQSYPYVNSNNNEIYIEQDDVCFNEHMKKFCGEEFEIVIQSNKQSLFRIIDSGHYWIITKHMVNIMESKGFEINKNWPLTVMIANDIIQNMWEYLYNNCNKSEQKVLDKISGIEYNLARKKVRVKSWEELTAEYEITEDGIKLDEGDYLFYNEMRPLCGKEFIANYRDDSYIICRLPIGGRVWEITRKMVAEI